MLITDSQKWFILASLIGGGWLLYLLAPVLTPFLFSALLAYLGDPLVDRLEAKKLSRTLSVVVVFAVMFIVLIVGLLIFLPILEKQAAALVHRIPPAIDWLQEALLPRLQALYGEEAISIDFNALKQVIVGNLTDVGSFARAVFAQLGRSSQVLIGWATFLFLVPVLTFYLLRDWDILLTNLRDLLPRKIEGTVSKLAVQIDEVLAEFLRGQVIVMAALASVYTAGLWLVGLELAFIVGMTAGLVSFVPYLGVIVGLILAGFAVLMQYHDVIHLLGIAAVFGVGQLLEGMVLSPLLVGDRIGLHPVAVIFAVLAGGQLFGFFGVLLALPVAAIIVVLLRYSKAQYQSSDLYA